jgi:hypothetical protein
VANPQGIRKSPFLPLYKRGKEGDFFDLVSEIKGREKISRPFVLSVNPGP